MKGARRSAPPEPVDECLFSAYFFFGAFFFAAFFFAGILVITSSPCGSAAAAEDRRYRATTGANIDPRDGASRNARGERSAQGVAGDLPLQCADSDSEEERGARAVSLGVLECPADQLPLHLL